ncbi:hypothetical protein [Mycolicibacterium komossense]|uniref:DUF732 domain-containing protein n=1 Tax=Mycolicibacterium komossense TaxID=1779 RepID=A0ABT3CL69_9MYCO|nr:hypothetical protein [Mycolicibacterium komossense]MCV7230200.1 hypothetical protein [Mycolicibacterium komossense]
MALSGLAAIAAVLVGCSETISGTPQADPAQAGIPLSPTTTSRPSRTSGPAPSATVPAVPTRTTTPGGVAPAGTDATCADFGSMDDAAKRALLVQLGKDNALIGQNPEMWVSIADMLCSITSPTALVKDVVMGKM